MQKIYRQNMVVYKRKNRFDNLYTRLFNGPYAYCKVRANWNYFVEYAIITR